MIAQKILGADMRVVYSCFIEQLVPPAPPYIVVRADAAHGCELTRDNETEDRVKKCRRVSDADHYTTYTLHLYTSHRRHIYS